MREKYLPKWFIRLQLMRLEYTRLSMFKNTIFHNKKYDDEWNVINEYEEVLEKELNR